MTTHDVFAAYRWAWAQRVPPEEKLLLLALADGEAEPRLDVLGKQTGLGFRSAQIVATRLHERGLIDDRLHPQRDAGVQPDVDEAETNGAP